MSIISIHKRRETRDRETRDIEFPSPEVSCPESKEFAL